MEQGLVVCVYAIAAEEGGASDVHLALLGAREQQVTMGKEKH